MPIIRDGLPLILRRPPRPVVRETAAAVTKIARDHIAGFWGIVILTEEVAAAISPGITPEPGSATFLFHAMRMIRVAQQTRGGIARHHGRRTLKSER